MKVKKKNSFQSVGGDQETKGLIPNIVQERRCAVLTWSPTCTWIAVVLVLLHLHIGLIMEADNDLFILSSSWLSNRRNPRGTRLQPQRHPYISECLAMTLAILQMITAVSCFVLGFMDMAFRRETAMVRTRAPMLAGVVMAVPSVVGVAAAQYQKPALILAWQVTSIIAGFISLPVVVYSTLTLVYSQSEIQYLQNVHIFKNHEYDIHDMFVHAANTGLLLFAMINIPINVAAAWISGRTQPTCSCAEVNSDLAPLIEDEYVQNTELQEISLTGGSFTWC
uniref:Uncharacterized protein n=1 Tax=Eptatretus burgeri TaxID=7764 RepID=A0A8C4QN54_EPTBU